MNHISAQKAQYKHAIEKIEYQMKHWASVQIPEDNFKFHIKRDV